MLPERCLAAATLAGVAPQADDLDWFDGMAPENLAEYAAAKQGPDAYAEFLTADLLPLQEVTGDDLVEAMGELLTPVDAAALTGDFAAYLAAGFRRALAQGVVGARDDGMAAFAPWSFDLGSITVPVAVWQGRQDAMVPYAHGVWLAEHIPTAEAHLFDDEGHLSLVNQLDVILAALRRLAGR